MTRRELSFTVTIFVPTARDAAAGLRHLWGRLGLGLALWQQRMTDRAQLRDLDERLRRDLNVRYEDALREACKPFWRP